MKFKIIILSAMLSLNSFAQKQICPQPQEIFFSQGTLQAESFVLKVKFKPDIDNLILLKEILPIVEKSKKSPVINITSLKKAKSGAYAIQISSQNINIQAVDQSALFYALKSLKQLIEKKGSAINIPLVQINDYPDVALRGTVEGFYGTPWSFEDRINQLKFYGDFKMNTYIYGPKDDPYHSSPYWRDAYPEDKAKEIKTLVEEAKRNHVDFVWAIHPGKDIKWNKTDSINLLSKFEKMYNLGVRSFAVFFDDIAGEGTNPAKQAGILNYLHQSFIKKYKDVNQLMMCPTEYNKSWSNPKAGTYLDILGEQLDPEIQIMWTGNRVISDIDIPTMDWINQRIKRKALIWWNFPVSDYVRDHLLMGPVYGNGLDIKDAISGFVSNPMEHAEASKIAIFGVANYTWNMAKFQSEQSFEAAIKFIMPDAATSFKLFAENNSDLGPNGHGYRRTETVRMSPIIQSLEKTLKTNLDLNLWGQVRNYYDSIAHTPEDILNKNNNPNLIKEIKPWVIQFGLLGQAGVTALDAIKNYPSLTLKENWDNYLKIANFLEEMKRNDKASNQNPYQPGVKTGSLVLMPFVQNTFQLLGTKLSGSDNNPFQSKRNDKLITDIEQIKNQNLISNEKQLAISPLLETMRMKPGNYFGLSWLDNRLVQQLQFNFNTSGFERFLKFEISENGKDWQEYPTAITEKTKNLTLKPNYRSIRVINKSDSTQTIYLKQFLVQSKTNDKSTDLGLTTDNDFNTFMVLAPQQEIKLQNNVYSSMTLFLDTKNQEVEVLGKNKRRLYIGKDNLIQLDKKALNEQTEFTLINKGTEEIKFYENKITFIVR